MPFMGKNRLVQGRTTLQLSLSSVLFVARETFSMLPEEILNGLSLYTNFTILWLHSTAGGGLGLINRINLTFIGAFLQKRLWKSDWILYVIIKCGCIFSTEYTVLDSFSFAIILSNSMSYPCRLLRIRHKDICLLSSKWSYQFAQYQYVSFVVQYISDTLFISK